MSEKKQQQAETLDQFLAQIMRERDLSITALARQSLHAYLDGARPSLESCRKLAFFLGVSTAKIVSLSYPNVQEKVIESLIEAYLELPDQGQRVAEDVIFALQRNLGKR